jgi:hypothetical protein
MDCEQLLAGLNDYVDGDHSTALCQALKEHLADCNPCQIVVDNIRRTITLYKAGEAIELPEELQQQLCGLLREHDRARFPSASKTGP